MRRKRSSVTTLLTRRQTRALLEDGCVDLPVADVGASGDTSVAGNWPYKRQSAAGLHVSRSPQSAPPKLVEPSYSTELISTSVANNSTTSTNCHHHNNQLQQRQTQDQSRESLTTVAKNNNYKEEIANDSSPEPIVEVHQTSSSSASSSSSTTSSALNKSHSSASSSGDDLEARTTTNHRQVTRRRTVRRRQHQTNSGNSAGPQQVTTSHVTIVSICKDLPPPPSTVISSKSTGDFREQPVAAAAATNTTSIHHKQNGEQHFRTQQVGSFSSSKVASQTSSSSSTVHHSHRKHTTRRLVSSSATAASPSSSAAMSEAVDAPSSSSPVGGLRAATFNQESSVHHSQSFSSSRSSTSSLSTSRQLASGAALVHRQHHAHAQTAEDHQHSEERHHHHHHVGDALSMSSSRATSSSVKTSASLFVSGAGGCTSNNSQPKSFLAPPSAASIQSDSSSQPQLALLMSPDVRSLVKEIGTDFAVLESALNGASGAGASGGKTLGELGASSSVSSRLFGAPRRLLGGAGGPTSCASSTSGGHNLFDEPLVYLSPATADSRQLPYPRIDYPIEGRRNNYDDNDGDDNYYDHSDNRTTIADSPATINELVSRARNTANRLLGRTSTAGSNMKPVDKDDYINKDDIVAISDNTAKHELDGSPSLSSQSGCIARKPPAAVSPNSNTEHVNKKTIDEQQTDLNNGNTNEKTQNSAAEQAANKRRQSHCKAVMSKSISRIERKLSDLCKKLEACNDTKEAIDLLNIMMNMVEKAWSVHSCGYDLGFKLCNTLREVGGLDIILSFIHDSGGDQALLEGDASGVHWTSLLLGAPTTTVSDNSKQHADTTTLKDNQPTAKTGLRLSLPRLASEQSVVATHEANANSVEYESMTTNDDNHDKKNEEVVGDECITQPDSCPKVDSQKISAAKDVDSDVPTSDLGFDSNSIELASNGSTPSSPPAASALDGEVQVQIQAQGQATTQKPTPTLKDLNQCDQDTQDEQDARARQEELVFLSARLLSQCLTSDNRQHIVDNGLQLVVKLACNFTTIKSTQTSGAQRLLMSRSKLMLMRQSSMAATSLATSRKQVVHDCVDMHAIIGTEILQHLFKHSEDTCSEIISLGGLQAILYGCRSSNIETLRRCASALANLALYGGPDSQQTMIEQKAHVWLFPLAFNKDDNIQYYACLAIAVLVANQEIEADVLKSSTLNLVEPFVTLHEPQRFATSSTAHIHGQSPSWLRRLIPLLESKREEARNLAAFHFAMEAYIKKAQGQTSVFKDICAVEPLRKVAGSPLALASKFACQALRLIGVEVPHKLSQQVPLWTNDDVLEWIGQIGFEKFRSHFVDSNVDGDLLLQLNEEMLARDIGICNGIVRRRFLRELSNLKRIADYSSADKSQLGALLQQHGAEFVAQYIYPLVQLGVTRDNLHLLDAEQLVAECQISNSIHRMKLMHAVKSVADKLAAQAAQRVAAVAGSCCGGELGTSGDLLSAAQLSSLLLQPEKTLDVFVSYRRATGSQLASLLKVHLQLRGFSVFIDVERLEAGKFDNNLLESIKSAKNFILVLSPHALDRCIGDSECKDWVHKEIVAALASNCNIIPVLDNFRWPDAEQLPEDMRSIHKWNGVLWIHDYQDACVDKVERFMRGELSSGACGGGGGGGATSATIGSQSATLTAAGSIPNAPSSLRTISATPSLMATPSSFGGANDGANYSSACNPPLTHPLASFMAAAAAAAAAANAANSTVAPTPSQSATTTSSPAPSLLLPRRC